MAITTKFADQGTTVGVMAFDEERITSDLRPAVYSVGFSMDTGFFLIKKGDRMSSPDKLYGNVQTRVDKVLNTYGEATSSFGVLLSGDKGSGKTMVSSLIANQAIDSLNLPVILVDQSLPAGGLASFIERLGECVTFFDEFGKNYRSDDDDQGKLLSLLDGTGSSKRLVLLTENERHNINSYMLNRPGRIWYHFEYGKLDEQTVAEYCAEHEIDEDTVQKIQLRRVKSYDFSFDILQAIVKEYKMYGGDVDELCDDLNIQKIRVQAPDELEVIEMTLTETGEELKLHNKDYPFPTPGNPTRLYLAGKDEDGDAIEDEASLPIFCRDRIFLNTKELMRKDGDIYHFLTTRDSDDAQVLLRCTRKEVSNPAY